MSERATNAGIIDRLIAFSVHNRALIFVLSFVFVLLGLAASTRVPIDAVPDVTNVQVQVITASPSLGPEDIETYVTFPIERAMAGLPGIEEVRSTSRPGISVVTLVFDDKTDLYFARQIVNERLNDAARNIPHGYGEPQLGPVSSGLGEVFHFEVKGEGHSLMERRAILDWQIAPRLKLIPGVVEINVFGGESKTMEVSIDPVRLAEMRVGITDVIDAIGRNHLAAGGAYIVDGRENVTVHGDGRVRTPEALANIALRTEGDATPLYLKQVADILYAPRVRYGAVTRDGRKDEAVVGVAMMLRGANSKEVVARIKEAVTDISKSLPPGVTIDPYYDRTDLVSRTIHTVSTNLIEASALVLVILFLTLNNARAGMVVAVSIPLALLGVFIGMWVGGVSGNLISLGAIDFGLVVDGAIIIVENALRRLSLEHARLGRALTDTERSEVVIESAQEVRSATAFGEAIIALVYVPILALESVEGRTFRPMALTVLFALLAAFILSLTLVPALASMALPKNATDKEGWLVHAASRFYKPVLAWSFRYPKFLGVGTVVVFAASVFLGSGMGREFLPKLDEGTMVLAMVRLPSVSLEQALDQSRQVETTLRKFPEVKSVVGRTGRAEIAIDPMGINMTDVYVMLTPKKEWKTASDREGLIEAFDKALKEEVPGAGFAYSQPIEMNTNDLLAGISSDLALHLYGPDSAQLKQVSDKMVRVLRDIRGAKDVHAEQIAGLNVLSVEVDRAAAARYGLDVKTVLDAISAIGGVEVGDVIEGSMRFPIQVRLTEEGRKDADVIARLPIRTPKGTLVPLGQVTKIQTAPGPSQIGREHLQRRITIQMNVRGRDIASFVDEARASLEREIKIPTGYYTAWAGEYERLQSATKRLLFVVPIALLLIIVLLVATFGSFRPALLIFLNVPLSATGGILALWGRDLPLSISSGVGFIALFGVAVLNGLVLISSIESLRRSHSIEEATRIGAEGRLRPVLTTALVASLGFLPMALATGAGAEVQRPLATVVIGGLISSTLLTLVVLPALFILITKSSPGQATPAGVAPSN